MNARRAVLAAVGYLAVLFVFGGTPGLVFGLVVVAAGLALRPPRSAFLALAVALMALAPFGLFAQGLPDTPVVGLAFAARHTAANALVGMSLATALWAAIGAQPGRGGEGRAE